MIRFRDAQRFFTVGDQVVRALDHVDLDIAAGEYLAITGPSGSGKSTLLNAIGLLDKLTGGSYELEGTDVTHLSDDELARTRRHLREAHWQRHLHRRSPPTNLHPELRAHR